ncbi:hypothetical protein Murru_1769 [Allomuricauda ruestringensis DSM 13258]|uniref:Uncharacterized protein n=1 Tax=Allomuricauda ruestringensis (strain DSM 13258 / CIP 107369 / LMG 19739 / B1) TaxID=886377 RepID=G2PJ10_ALLRU|nr:hypothetical protein Murru_1769 [Allomuricauda ruestringensis DSM 13258]
MDLKIHSFQKERNSLSHLASSPPLIPPRRETSPLWGGPSGDFPLKLIETKLTAIKPDYRQTSLQDFNL